MRAWYSLNVRSGLDSNSATYETPGKVLTPPDLWFPICRKDDNNPRVVPE